MFGLSYSVICCIVFLRLRNTLMAKKKSKVTKVDNKKKKNKSRGVSPFVHWLFYWMKSWFSNDRCIEARELNGLSAILIAFVSVILACLPNLTTRLSTDAGTVLNTPTYNLENSLVAFQEAATENNLQINISGGVATINNFDTMTTDTLSSGTKYWAHKYTTTKHVNVPDSTGSSSSTSTSSHEEVQTVTVYDLLVFRVPTSDTVSSFITNTLTVANDPNKWYSSTQSIFATNAIVIGNNGLGIYKANENVTSATSIAITYEDSMFDGKNLITVINDLISQKTTSTVKTSDEYRNAVIDSYKQVIVAGYQSTKVATAWMYTGIAYLINTVMLLVFGLTLFLMTRGKNNPYRDYKFLQCLKIISWASFSPALLSLIAFIPAIGSSAIGLLIFVLLLGLRTMWMSMKNLRPVYE